MKIQETLASKTRFETILYLALLIGLIGDLAFLALDLGDVTFSVGCFACILAGSLIGLADVFFSKEIFLWLASLCYAAGVGFHLHVALPSISDLWYQVNFIGGNQPLAIAFGILFIVILVLLLVSNFVIDRGQKQKAAA